MAACLLLGSLPTLLRPTPIWRCAAAARACTTSGSVSTIVRAFEEQPSPATFTALCEAADDFLMGGDFSAAEACYRPLLRLDPHDAGVRERLAACLRGAGQMHDAANELHMALSDVENAEDRGWLYLDLGSLLEDLAPVPGTGVEWAAAPDDDLVRDGKVRLGKGIEWTRIEAEEEEEEASSSFAIGLAEDEEWLSAEDCYRRAIALQPEHGEAYKRLADWLVMAPGGAAAAVDPFATAASLLPDDICAATHCFYGAPEPHALPPLPLPAALPTEAAPQLADITMDVLADEAKDDEATVAWVARAAESFERHGCLVLPGFLVDAECDALAACVRSASDDEHVLDFLGETRAASRRMHKALPVSAAHAALDGALARLWPLLSTVLQAEAASSTANAAVGTGSAHVPLVGSGFMSVGSGAEAQSLHKDVHGFDRHGSIGAAQDGVDSALPAGGGARAVSIQLQLTDTTRADAAAPPTGSLELLPGSHRPDAATGRSEVIRAACEDSSRLVPVDVGAGTVTIYSSRLWHRGGANQGKRERVFAFLTLAEASSAAPPGLIHTMTRDDVGAWIVGAEGLVQRE